ncbi:MAG: hypothetical protein KAR20_24655 [Candidatus Heimdallarchaeota archaeon]|nr:hypothetical protein [Candidatus Heimdallarchaeota archaeon]
MEENLITLEASSPDELKEVLTKLSKRNKRDCLYGALAISDPQLLLYPFNFKDVPLTDIKKQVSDEIKEIFSMPISEIEYDFQIFTQEESYISGVCAAIPKKCLYQYLSILDKNKLVPLRIVPYSSAIIDYYFHQHKDPNISFAVIDFSKKYMVSMAVFKNDHCQLLRQIPYERLDDVKSEIINSLKNACVLSGIAQLERIHFAGNLEDKMEIIGETESAFQAKIERDHSIDIVTALSLEDYYFDINFSRRHTFSEFERIQATHIMNLCLALYCLFIVFLGSQIFYKFRSLNNLNESYTLTDYDYAKNLKKELDLL